MEFLANLVRSHSFEFSNEHWASYGFRRKLPHGRGLCLVVCLDLEIKFSVGRHLATKWWPVKEKSQSNKVRRIQGLPGLRTPCISSRNSVVLQIPPGEVEKPVSLELGISLMKAPRALLAFPMPTDTMCWGV